MAVKLEDIIIKPSTNIYNDVVRYGPVLSPQQFISTFNDKDWEGFIEECTFELKKEYIDVKRTGGAGDQGIDVAAFKTNKFFEGAWDNYQCKYYNHSLEPAEMVIELGKLCYYTFIKEYTIPDNYYFAAPHGVGTSFAKMLRGDHQKLKDMLISKWKEKCEKKITNTKNIILEGELKTYVENFDFSIFKDITLLKLLEIHRRTPYYHTRFPGGLPSRPISEKPPEQITNVEVIYIQKLLDAYADFLSLNTCSISDLNSQPLLKSHLQKSRVQFYCAESLHKFSRDYLPPGEYERLQDLIFEGVENIILSNHIHGFERVKQVIQEAYKIQIDSHPLKDRIDLSDRAGICHQLANNNKVTWANDGNS